MKNVPSDMVVMNDSGSEKLVLAIFDPLWEICKKISKDQLEIEKKLKENYKINNEDAQEMQEECREIDPKNQDWYELRIEQVMNVVFELIDGAQIPPENLKKLREILSEEQIRVLQTNLKIKF